MARARYRYQRIEAKTRWNWTADGQVTAISTDPRSWGFVICMCGQPALATEARGSGDLWGQRWGRTEMRTRQESRGSRRPQPLGGKLHSSAARDGGGFSRAVGPKSLWSWEHRIQWSWKWRFGEHPEQWETWPQWGTRICQSLTHKRVKLGN